MKTRKSKDLEKTLVAKGFELNPAKHSHRFFSLIIDGKRSPIFTFVSHGSKTYGKELMSEIKKQMKFTSPQQLDQYFDCSMSGNDYINMLKEQGIIK